MVLMKVPTKIGFLEIRFVADISVSILRPSADQRAEKRANHLATVVAENNRLKEVAYLKKSFFWNCTRLNFIINETQFGRLLRNSIGPYVRQSVGRSHICFMVIFLYFW